MVLSKLAPMLSVVNMDETIDYYEKILGFTCVARMEDDWCNLERDNISIMLSSSRNQQPRMTGSIYVYTDTVDDLWLEIKDEVEVSYPIETFDYGMREFGIVDCNGYLLQFGQMVD